MHTTAGGHKRPLPEQANNRPQRSPCARLAGRVGTSFTGGRLSRGNFPAAMALALVLSALPMADSLRSRARDRPPQVLRDPGQPPRDMSHNAGLRQLGNRLVGILHGCLKTGTLDNQATAWSHRYQHLTA